MRRFRTRDDTVRSQAKKMAALSAVVALPATAPGRALLGYAGRSTLRAAEGILSDPLGSMQRTDRILKSYRLAGKAAAAYKGLSRFMEVKQSPSSSTSSYQQYGGGGDTPSITETALGVGYLVHQAHGFMTEKSYPKHPAMPCRPGFVEKRIKGKLMCVRVKHKRK